MPDQNDTNTIQPTVTPVAPANPAATAAPDVPTATPDEPEVPTPIIPDEVAPTLPTQDVNVAEVEPEPAVDNSGIIADVATKINDAHNILVALSSDPSVDEMCAAIGLTLFLDRFSKRVTAIYSGNTPNALEFLKPEETFEQNADTLQDFVIALNKEKADHLRYKLDGEYVKIFITPYRSRISNEDLEFSYGDFNVDLVLALDVANGVDLDAALREHGRIMHDAVVVNITTGNPGKLGEIEWSDKTASSVSEMIAELLYKIGGKEKIEKEEATAFLTGIVAATNRFASASTTPKTMEIASRLMDSGANQQLISKNITPDIENELFTLSSTGKKETNQDPTKLDIEHDGKQSADEDKQVETTVTEKDSTLLEDLKAAEASLANAAAEVTPEAVVEPFRINGEQEPDVLSPVSAPVAEPAPTVQPLATPEQLPAEPILDNNFASEVKPEKVITPPEDFATGPLGEGTNKYGQMLEDALAEANDAEDFTNPAVSSAPTVAAEPEINGVPEINYMPMPGDEVLPPPPTPPVNFDSVPDPGLDAVNPEDPTTLPPVSAPATTPEPTPEPAPTSLGPQPAMQDQVYAPQVSNPAAFKIPGIQ